MVSPVTDQGFYLWICAAKKNSYTIFFFTLKISTYLYDWRTPGYAVAHPAYPVGPSLNTVVPVLRELNAFLGL